MTTPSDVFKEAKRIQKTVWWMEQEVARSVGEFVSIDPNTTINHKFGFSDGVIIPNAQPSIKYFGIGTRGYYNTDDQQGWNVYEIPSDNMDLYRSMPIRVVPLANDLVGSERAMYAGRVVVNIEGTLYATYRLKRLVRLSGVTKTIKNVVTGIEEPWTPDYSKLNPNPFIPPSTGTITGSSTELNVTATMQARVLGSEIMEAVSVLYGGNMQYSHISEWGFFSGVDVTASGDDYLGNSFTYTEAAMCQLAVAITTKGGTPEESNGELVRTLRIGVSDIALL